MTRRRKHTRLIVKPQEFAADAERIRRGELPVTPEGVAGGQGRDAESVQSAGVAVFACVTVAVVLLAYGVAAALIWGAS